MKHLMLVLCLVLSISGTKPKPIMSCGPTSTLAVRSSISTVQSGKWSDPVTWGGKIPTATDSLVIGASHVVTFDTSVSIAGMQVQGKLTFDPTKSVTLKSTKNIIVTGTLEMQSPISTITQLIQFTGINESKVVGGGMDPIATDVGLWVMGAGKLNLQGASKNSWTNASSGISAGSTVITVKDATNWKVGDEIIITATETGASNYDLRTIKSISGITLTLDKATTSHAVINNYWTAEVGNLTRNVRIEGTATGKAHVFIRSTSPQSIKNVAFRYLGQRKNQGGRTKSDLILGRYGLHFHHNMDGSVGSIVQNTVMRDLGNHAYVPHVSNGVTMRDNIAYNCKETPFWWDLPDVTHGTTWVHNLVVQPTYDEGSIGVDTEGAPTFGVNGFILGMGDDNRCDSNVVAGQIGLETTNASYDWEEMDIESAWTFKGNLAHNCMGGIRSWQNNAKNHVLTNTQIYNSSTGVFHGAYGNNYTYMGGYLYNASFEDHAAGAMNSVRLENLTMDGANLIDYPFHMVNGPLKGDRPIFMRNCTIKNGKIGAILNESTDALKSLDIIQSTITGKIAISTDANSDETIRVQPIAGQPYQLTKSGQSSIVSFASPNWGSGVGLTGKYYNGSNFNSLVETRTDPIINFEEWMIPLPGSVTGVHYKITSKKYTVRYTGIVESQFNENYKFSVDVSGGVRVWVNGKLLIDKWFETYAATYTSANIALQAKSQYRIQIEYLNDNDDRSYLKLFWQSPSQPYQLIPQTQLYPY